MYGEGISKTGELLDLGVAAGIVEKSGSWFSFDGQRIGQGRQNAKEFLKENAEMADVIECKVRENAGLISERMLDGSTADTSDDDDIEGIQENHIVAKGNAD